jgi:2-polyprenyl-6-methoxyphenol hydroxylase-like FAD-dependent oxidoreductase
MSKVVVVGAGVVGLGTAMLLARDGHDVVVLERDPDPPTPDAADAWTDWQRKGVNQFRLPHFMLARYRQFLDNELPDAARAIEDAGGLRTNVLLNIPEAARGPEQPGDRDFEVLTARRPVLESALAHAAQSTDGVEIRRGVAVEALVVGGTSGSVPDVVGVTMSDGTDVRGDLVVDMTGRRSPLARLLTVLGRPPIEEVDDSGFMYFARHFESSDGSVPFAFGPALMNLGSLSTLTLAADNGTWGVGLIISSKDRALYGLKDPKRWEQLVRALPLVAHWLEGSAIDDGVTTMSKIEDRIRTFVVDGQPVATGVVAVADAWACSNPTLGRGVSIGSMHAVALRDAIRDVGLGDRAQFAMAFHDATEATVRPWFEWTRWTDRHRIAEIDALASDASYEPDDERWEFEQALGSASNKDPELLRAFVRAVLVLDPLDETLREPAIRAKVLDLGSRWRDDPVLAPSRAELVSLASS